MPVKLIIQMIGPNITPLKDCVNMSAVLPSINMYIIQQTPIKMLLPRNYGLTSRVRNKIIQEQVSLLIKVILTLTQQTKQKYLQIVSHLFSPMRIFLIFLIWMEPPYPISLHHKFMLRVWSTFYKVSIFTKLLDLIISQLVSCMKLLEKLHLF